MGALMQKMSVNKVNVAVNELNVTPRVCKGASPS